MLRDPQGRMPVLGAALAGSANVLMMVPAVSTGIPFAVPSLAVMVVAGLALVCHNGIALATRRRGRGRRG
jgi:hypothetical protein